MTVQSEVEIVDNAGGLVLRRVVVGPFATNCWIVIDARDQRAVIVDPGDEPHRILDACADLHVGAVVLTHTHWGSRPGAPRHRRHPWCRCPRPPGRPPRVGSRVPAPAPSRPLRRRDSHRRSPRRRRPTRIASRPGTVGRANDRRRPPREDPGRRRREADGPPHSRSYPRRDQPPSRGHVFTGDTLFPGGPGLTGWPLSDFPTIIDSINHTLFRLPHTTRVHPGHGESTTIGAERPHLDSWIKRGW